MKFFRTKATNFLKIARKSGLVLLLVVFHHLLIAQKQTFKLNIVVQDESFKTIEKKAKFKSEKELIIYGQSLLKKWQSKGYLAASIDSIRWDESLGFIYLTKGNPYFWSNLTVNTPVKSHQLNSLKKSNRPIQLTTYNKLLESIYSDYKNNGYPFCQIEKDALIGDSEISLHLKIHAGQQFRFDSLQLSGIAKLSPRYISGLTGIKINHPYDESLIQQASYRIENAGFLRLDSLMTEIEEPDQIKVNLNISALKTNSFEGMLGFQPDEQHKTQVTGNINLYLRNSFKQGELLELIWNKPSSFSQELTTHAEIDYIAGSTIGAVGRIHIEKVDSTFTSSNYRIGLSMFLNHLWKLTGYSQIKNSTGVLENTDNYPKINHLLYGLRLTATQFDYIPNPSKGFKIDLETNTGNKTLWKADQQKIKSNLTEFKSDLQLVYPFIFGVVALSNQSSALLNNALSLNELYRIGGLRTMRGFNDNSIYCRGYSIFTFEYRWLFNKNSTLYLFNDFGYFSEPEQTHYKIINRYALGAGLNLSTKAGILSVAYAVGKLQSEPLSINKALIQLGYKNYF